MSDNAVQSGAPAPKTSQATSADKASSDKRALLAEVGAKWDRLSAQDLAGLKDNDDLAQQIVEKYGIPRNDAHRDVVSLLNGRTL